MRTGNRAIYRDCHFVTQYDLIKKIGGGSFGQIFIGEDTRNHKKVAVKLENRRTNVPQLEYESKLYVLFSGCPSVPRLHWYGKDHSHNIMVIDLLGKSLEDLFVQCGQRLSLKTVLMLADQMISCVQYIHSKNFIHNDIKPDNFVMGCDDKANEVFVIDFGLSKKYRDPFSHQHIPYADGRDLTGTPRYASVNALKGVRQTRRDDMESLGYVWIYLLKGSLPCMGINLRVRDQKFEKITAVKAATSIESLCAGFPSEFVDYFRDVRSLKFDEELNYTLYRERFRKLFIKRGYVFDYVYDWTDPAKMKKKELIIHVEPKKPVPAAPKPPQKLQLPISNNIARERRELMHRAQRQELEKEKAKIPEPPTHAILQNELQKETKLNLKKDEKPDLIRKKPGHNVPPPQNIETNFDIDNLPKGGPLPNGPFPRPMWRSRYPRWMTSIQSLQIR